MPGVFARIAEQREAHDVSLAVVSGGFPGDLSGGRDRLEQDRACWNRASAGASTRAGSPHRRTVELESSARGDGRSIGGAHAATPQELENSWRSAIPVGTLAVMGSTESRFTVARLLIRIISARESGAVKSTLSLPGCTRFAAVGEPPFY